MEKFITITDTTSGQKRLIPLNNISDLTSTTTSMTVGYKTPVGGGLSCFITHDTAPNSGLFRTWFVEQMEPSLQRIGSTLLPSLHLYSSRHYLNS